MDKKLYLQLLQDPPDPALAETIERNTNELTFQHDGARPHYTLTVR